MFARHTYMTGDPQNVDDAVTATTKRGREMLREQPGYAGMAVFADRELGKLLVGSFWETEQACRDSDDALREQRAAMLRPFAATIAVDVFEVAVAQVSRRPGPGAAMRRTMLEYDPADTDRLIETLRAVTPKLDPVPGFCRSTAFVDRTRGRCVIGVVYADREALSASRSPAAALRGEVTQAGGSTVARTVCLEEFDVMLFEAPSP